VCGATASRAIVAGRASRCAREDEASALSLSKGVLPDAMDTGLIQVTTGVASGKHCPHQQIAEAPPAQILSPSPNDRPECGERQTQFGRENVLQHLNHVGF